MEKHHQRWKRLSEFDANQTQEASQRYNAPCQGIIGVDEVGRGSLIGPVVAAAVCLPAQLDPDVHKWLLLLDDSKAPHLNRSNRLELTQHLKTHTQWGVASASLEEIERYNIVNASLLAGHRAIMDLAERFQCALQQHLVMMDGRQRIPQYPHPQKSQIKGDKYSAAIAAASIVAKSTRDSLVDSYAMEYPGYGWESNAGYPTPAHQKAIAELGITPLHRKTYKVVRELAHTQLSLTH